MILHGCIFAPYEVCKDIASVWAEKCTSLLVAEHPADGKTKRVHCHFMIDTTLADDNPFREAGKKCMKEFFKRGNMWIASRVQKGEHQGQVLDKGKVMVYILKGKYAPKFLKNISDQEVDEARQAWVEKVNSDEPAEDSPKHTDVLICKVVEVVETKLNTKRYDGDEDGIELYRTETILDLCRNEAFKMLYRAKRVAPHAAHYKIIASSAYLRIMEKLNKFDEGIVELKNLWY